MVGTAQEIMDKLSGAADKDYHPERVFKRGAGEYGEGDIFIGVRVPEIRRIVKPFKMIRFEELQKLLTSRVHEHRFAALVILVNRYKQEAKTEDVGALEQIFKFYIDNTEHINNWDLVDCSAPNIVGAHLYDKDRSILYSLAASDNIWEQRISILSTFYFIKRDDFADVVRISEILLTHPHDLIHKAVGWMLREMGNRDMSLEEQFLKKHHTNMPRTMLRYAIEKFPEEKRLQYLKKSPKRTNTPT